MTPPVLILPGLWNSGPQHWQTLWENTHPQWIRVEQRDWERPHRDDWVDTLEQAVRACSEPPYLIAHSLGCALVAHWSQAKTGSRVAGAFLVAPSDVDAPSYPEGTHGFKPMPLAPLPFRSLVVASSNDEYVTIDRARQFADAWGSELVIIGDAGHINSASGLGNWPMGAELFRRFAHH